MASADLIETEGTVTDQHANGRFTVRLDSGQTVFVYATGKMRQHKIQIVAGDRVTVQLSPFEPGKGRITYRAR